MSQPNISEKSFERCCQRFSRELGSVFGHPNCPERIRELIKLFSNEIREEYIAVISVEAQAKEIRFSTLSGLVELAKAPTSPVMEAHESSND